MPEAGITGSIAGWSAARWFLLLGAVNAALAVMAGAFGAHALKDSLADNLLQSWHTGASYHFWHALGLLAVGLIGLHWRSSWLLAASGWLMLAGIALFCGSLYVLSLTGMRGLGMVTPFGGLAFIVAWFLLAAAVVVSP